MIGNTYDAIITLEISASGEHVAYAGRKNGKVHLVVDHVEYRSHDQVANIMIEMNPLLPLYNAQDYNKWSIYHNGVAGRSYDDIWYVYHSNDSQHYSYVGQNNHCYDFVLDEIERYTGFDEMRPVGFSPNGQSWSFWEKTGLDWHLYINGFKLPIAYSVVYDNPGVYHDNMLRVVGGIQTGGDNIDLIRTECLLLPLVGK